MTQTKLSPKDAARVRCILEVGEKMAGLLATAAAIGDELSAYGEKREELQATSEKLENADGSIAALEKESRELAAINTSLWLADLRIDRLQARLAKAERELAGLKQQAQADMAGILKTISIERFVLKLEGLPKGMEGYQLTDDQVASIYRSVDETALIRLAFYSGDAPEEIRQAASQLEAELTTDSVARESVSANDVRNWNWRTNPDGLMALNRDSRELTVRLTGEEIKLLGQHLSLNRLS